MRSKKERKPRARPKNNHGDITGIGCVTVIALVGVLAFAVFLASEIMRLM